jgi:hypothetical protein
MPKPVAAMAERKPHLSISQLTMLSRCGEQYRRRYIEHEIRPPAVAMLVGRATDESVNQNLKNKIDTGELLERANVSDIARDAFVSSWEGGVALSDEELAQGLKTVRGAALDKSVRLSLLHADVRAPSIQPTAIQRYWRVELKGYSRDLVGVIDIQEGLKSVRDTKTAAKTPPKTIAETDDQLTAYALAVRVLEGKAPERVALDYLVDLKSGAKAPVFESVRDDSDFQTFLNRLETAMEGIEKGVFIPANPNEWCCSKKWCGWWDVCKYAKRPHTVSLTELGGSNDNDAKD